MSWKQPYGVSQSITLPPGVTSTTISISPFECSLGYQPLMSSSQEDDIAVPSVQCPPLTLPQGLERGCAVLLRSTECNRHLANWHWVPAPNYLLGQMVWLLAKDIPLKKEANKLSPIIWAPLRASSIPPWWNSNPSFHYPSINPFNLQSLCLCSAFGYHLLCVHDNRWPLESEQLYCFVFFFFCSCSTLSASVETISATGTLNSWYVKWLLHVLQGETDCIAV